MSGYGGYYGKKYASSVVTRMARTMEPLFQSTADYQRPPTWNELLRLARNLEEMVRGREQSRYRDWRDD